MPDVRHLSRPPIVEALMNFQANAAPRWNPEKLRPVLSGLWPAHTVVEELRLMEIQMRPAEKQSESTVTMGQLQGFIFRSPSELTVHQARRDGYAFSRLAPYEDWNSFETQALRGWADYQSILEPEELHAVTVRFINRMIFPAEGMRLSRYFTTHPCAPPESGWTIYGFTHQTLYALDSPCVVRATIASEATPFSFILDIEIFLREPFSALERGLNEILREMHDLKNQAFFRLLTNEAVERYI
jgi:uncharacterized protein (TIGR04255 family)